MSGAALPWQLNDPIRFFLKSRAGLFLKGTIMNWTTKTTKGEPTYIQDGEILTIVNKEGDRGMWTANIEAIMKEGDQVVFNGQWEGGKVRVLFRNESGQEIGSLLPESGQIIDIPPSTFIVQINCVLSGPGTAVFQNIRLGEEKNPDPGLQIPEVWQEESEKLSGWKWGSIIMLYKASEAGGPTFPPTYVDEWGEIIPYEVKGEQRGRHISLEIGNMQFTDEEE